MKEGMCKKCAHYKVFYMRLYWYFCKKERGLCGKNEKIVFEQDCCEHFNVRKKIAKEIIKDLDNSIEEINELKRFYNNY